MAQKRINPRSLTALFMLFGFLIMSITGLILYIVPVGRLAYWLDWQLFSLSKTDWENVHILSSIMFITAGAFHIFFNWKPLIHYCKSKVTAGIRLHWELSISAAVSVLLVVSALYTLPPLSYFLDLNKFLKDAWAVQADDQPPFGHAARLTLDSFVRQMDIDLAPAMEKLKTQGVVFASPEETLEDIARANNMLPRDIYLMIKEFELYPTKTRQP
ncbi:DUF4405 domain-containing protein [Candidatus Zixiibacteriota bacterium]